MKIFQKNNHSKYLIRWKKIDRQKAEEIRDLISKNYDFNEVKKNIRQVDEWEKMSNNFRIKARIKNKWKKFLFRKHIQLKDEKSIEILDEIFIFLKKRGISVSAIVRTKDKKTNFFSGGNFYVLYDFIEGNHYKGSAKELAEAAKGIALLHKVLTNIPMSFLAKIKSKPILLPPWSTSGWQEIFNKANLKKTNIDVVLIENKNLIFQEIKKIEKARKTLNKLERQLVHTDLHPQNTIFSNEKLKALLDFEGMRDGELLRDIGNACHRFVRQFVVFQRKDFNKTLSKGIQIFLREYSKFNLINQNEKKIIPLLISDEILRKLYKDINAHYFLSDSSKIEGGELEKKLILLKESEIISNFIK